VTKVAKILPRIVLVSSLIGLVSTCTTTQPRPPRASPAPGSLSLRADAPTFHRPYNDEANNFIYNLLFCDDLTLFRPKEAVPGGTLAVLLSSNPSTEDLQRIANDDTEESRNRILAFNYLRSKNVKVPAGRVLGVVVEVALDAGLDTLAVFVDGRMRYINHSGKLAIFEATPASMEADRKNLMRASAEAAAEIGPWDKPRRPPPTQGDVRLTFLVSDGIYFGEGPLSGIEQDPIGGSVLQAATQVLMKIAGENAK
jgi:hypothetical protein